MLLLPGIALSTIGVLASQVTPSRDNLLTIAEGILACLPGIALLLVTAIRRTTAPLTTTFYKCAHCGYGWAHRQ